MLFYKPGELHQTCLINPLWKRILFFPKSSYLSPFELDAFILTIDIKSWFMKNIQDLIFFFFENG